MAHAPEKPQLYVCTDCQVLHAGTVEHVEDGHHYHPPAECGACGNTGFVTQGEWPHQTE